MGNVVWRSLHKAGFSRDDCHVTNAVLCFPDRQVTPAEWRQALDCCKPRLEAELSAVNCNTILSQGSKALQTLTGRAQIMNWCGSPQRISFSNREYNLLPNIHPANVIRGKTALLPINAFWNRRAVRMAKGELEFDAWQDIYTTYGNEMFAALLRICSSNSVALDVETAGLDPMQDPLLCVGIADETESCSVPYPFNEETRLLFTRVLCAETTEKIFHNAQHDLLSLEAAGFKVRGDIFDTMLAHNVVAPQLPHDLGFVAATLTTLERWKSIFRVTGDAKGLASFTSRPAEELRRYNAKDAGATWLIAQRLKKQVMQTHCGDSLFKEITKLSAIALNMKRIGMSINSIAIQEHRKVLRARKAKKICLFRAEILALTNSRRSFKLGKSGQHPNLRKLFFDKLHCIPFRYSEETREPKLDALTLEQYSAEGTPETRRLARLTLDYRKDAKLLSTYIEGLPISKDGCVHVSYKIHGPITGRWSASPNIQNQPPIMRNIWSARPGKYLVSGDYSQLELRILAFFSGDRNLLKWFAEGRDVHATLAEAVFKTKPTKRLRDIMKRIEYGLIYGGQPETIWRVIASQYPEVSFSEVLDGCQMLKEILSDATAWQEELLNAARKNKFVEEPLSGRREYFYEGFIEPTKVVNFPIQGAAAKIMNDAVQRLHAALDYTQEALLLQVHDELGAEGPDKQALIVKIKTAMEHEVVFNGRQTVFPVDMKVSKLDGNWGKMEAAID